MLNSKKAKSFAVGAVVGGLAGAVSALLFAPKAGRELRKDIADGATAAAHKTQQIAVSVTERTKEAASSVASRTGEWYGKAAELAGVVRSEVQGWKNGRLELPEVDELPTSGESSVQATIQEGAQETGIEK